MLRMEWLLIGLLVLVILVNIRSFILLNQLKQQKDRFDQDTADLYRNLEKFTADVEEKNNELYEGFIAHLGMQETNFNEKIRQLEERVASGSGNVSPEEPAAEQPLEQLSVDVTDSVAGLEENKKVETLFKQGFSAEQIAKVLRMEQGKTQVIVNMLDKKRSYQK